MLPVHKIFLQSRKIGSKSAINIITAVFRFKEELRHYIIKAFNVRLTIIDVGWSRIGIENNVVLAINRGVVEVEKALRFIVARHETAFWVGGTHLGILGFRRVSFFFEGLFPRATRSFSMSSLNMSM